ncbi:MAG TPA: MauE/DoxX family redox-associated membrane protein [Chloroflexota bacterium]|nr:MauE/DoxX family redox-associated membrane protein [Chloroflexota bacterium]
MEALLLAARLFLALVFIVAGIGKLADQPGFRTALADFGVPIALTPFVAPLIPLLEIAVTIALLTTVAAWWGSIGAVALLILFTVAIVANLVQGRQPDCHCFGQTHSEPASWMSVARNAALLIPAALVLAAGPTATEISITSWADGLSLSNPLVFGAAVILLAIIAALAWLCLTLFRRYGRLLVRLEALENGASVPSVPDLDSFGLPPGVPAPGFALPALDDGIVGLHDLLAIGKPILLVFADPSCGSCGAVLPEIRAIEDSGDPPATVAVVSRGSAEANRQRLSSYGFQRVILQTDMEVASAFGVPGTPGAVIISPNGSIASRTALGVPAIQELLETLPSNLPTPAPVLP